VQETIDHLVDHVLSREVEGGRVHLLGELGISDEGAGDGHGSDGGSNPGGNLSIGN
jgi:hypothetical protein